MRTLLAAACLLAAMPLVAPTLAHAAPFCIVEGGGAGYESCAFETMEQCRASAEGSRAVCTANPHEPPVVQTTGAAPIAPVAPPVAPVKHKKKKPASAPTPAE